MIPLSFLASIESSFLAINDEESMQKKTQTFVVLLCMCSSQAQEIKRIKLTENESKKTSFCCATEYVYVVG